MIAITLDIDKKLLTYIELYGRLATGQAHLSNLEQAVEAMTNHAQAEWGYEATSRFQYSHGAYLGKVDRMTYHKGINEGLQYPVGGDPLWGQVINTVPYARYLEEGTSQFDMKKALQTSPKVRTFASGKKYLIIPFRHGTPRRSEAEAGRKERRATLRTMPESIYGLAQKLVASQRTGTYLDKQSVERSTYKWRGGLTQKKLETADLGKEGWEKPSWKSSKFAGMVKFPRRGPGHEYVTFRIMAEGQTGWIHPGIQAMHLARNTAERIRPEIMAALKDGLRKDMDELRRAV